MNKQHYKLYKSGKLWISALIVGASLGVGVLTQTTAHADANNNQVVGQTNLQNTKAASLQTSDNAAPQSAVNNKVPTDKTTFNNDVNANQGHLDSYSLSQNEKGQTVLHASGWQASGQSNNQSYRYVIVYDHTDHREVKRQKIAPQQRPDVQRAYPHIDNSQWSGFDFDIALPNTEATHSLSVVARYSNDAVHGEGNHTDYWFGPLYLDQNNRAHLDHIEVKDDKINISGWHASNAAANKHYHYIIAYDQTQHREIARQEVTPITRQDVAKVYPTIANAINSGFNISFNFSPLYASDDIQFVSRWTNDPHGNGSAVDYWFGAINRDNEGYLDRADLSSGNLRVSGWHANDTSIYAPHHYLIVFDQTANRQVVSAEVAVKKSADVAKAFPAVKTAKQARFSYDFGQLTLLPGHHYSLVSRYSTSAHGNGGSGVHVDYWFNMFTLNNSDHFVDGWDANQDHLSVHGWMASDEALTNPYAYAILLNGNGHELQRQRLTLTARPDVAKVYPHLYNSGKSGFSASFTIPANELTNNLQLVLRFTNDPNGNGAHTTDFWSDKLATNAGSWDKVQVNGNSIDLAGWHAATNVTDKPYQYIIALDSLNGNRELRRWRIDQHGNWQASAARGDVQHAFPWIWNSGQSGFSGTVDLSNLNHRLVTFLHRYTDDKNGNGHYVDFYSSPVDVHFLSDRLQQAWSNIINNSGRRVSIAVQSQQTGLVYSYTNVPGYRFDMASTVKVSVLSQLLHITGGNLDGTEQALASNMIRNSDNDSTSTLFDYYIGGTGGIGQLYSALGMNESSTNDAWGLTATTAADQLKLLNEIYLNPRTNYLNDQSRNYIRSLMGSINPSQRWGISTGSGNFYVKNGWLPYDGSWHVNSIGFIPGNGNSYTIAVYTDGNGTMQDGINLIQQLAIATKQIMQ